MSKSQARLRKIRPRKVNSFYRTGINFQENQTEVELRQAFRLLDTDDNGYITESEIRYLDGKEIRYLHASTKRSGTFRQVLRDQVP